MDELTKVDDEQAKSGKLDVDCIVEEDVIDDTHSVGCTSRIKSPRKEKDGPTKSTPQQTQKEKHALVVNQSVFVVNQARKLEKTSQKQQQVH